METKMNDYVKAVFEWIIGGRRGKKPTINLSLEDVFDAPWIFVRYQYIEEWVAELDKGNICSYSDYCHNLYLELNKGI